MKGDISPLEKRGTGHKVGHLHQKEGRGKGKCDSLSTQCEQWPCYVLTSQLEEGSSFLMLENVNWLCSSYLNTDSTTGNNMTYYSPVNEEEKYLNTSVLASAGVALQNLLSYSRICSD